MNHLHRAWKEETAVRMAAAAGPGWQPLPSGRDDHPDPPPRDPNAGVQLHRRTGSRDWLDTQPQPAEAATEVGSDDLGCARGIVIAFPAALLAWAVIAAGAVAFKFWPQIAAFLGFGPTP